MMSWTFGLFSQVRDLGPHGIDRGDSAFCKIFEFLQALGWLNHSDNGLASTEDRYSVSLQLSRYG